MTLDEQHQRMAVGSISHAATMAGEVWKIAGYEHSRPSAVWRPKVYIDGNQWCALYGDNLQDGVAGFGDSPEKAMLDFDKAWTRKLDGPKDLEASNEPE